MIVPLNSKKKSNHDVAHVGGKGANLLRLYQLGFPIPPGFIITTGVFDKFIRQSPENVSIIRTSDFESRDFDKNPLSSLCIDQALKKKIEENLHKLSGKFAVRSSMVQEDQVNTSFAGQLNTYLNVPAENVLSAIEKCYLSLYNPNVQQYISAKKPELADEETNQKAMAVVVQQMVQAKYSGIAFTANPMNGRREVIIEATAGVGEKIVSEGVTPDRYIVNARGKIVKMTPVTKDHPLLTTEQILLLAESANLIARQIGSPQDIEWAWDGESFIFLQARPITNLYGKNIYSSKLMSDMSPGLLKPMQWSTFTQAMVTNVFGRLFTEIIGPNNFDFKLSIRLIHSRLYANVTFFEELLNQLGLPVNFFEMITRDENEHRRKPPLTIRFLFVLVFRFVPFVWKYARVSEQMNDFLIKQDGLLEKYRETDWIQAKIKDKFQHLNHLIDLHHDAQWNIIICSFNMSIRNTLLKKMVRRHAPAVESSDLIKGLSGLKGLEPNRYMDKLSEQLQRFPEEVIRLCIEGNNLLIQKELSSSQAGEKLLADFHTFLRKFGHFSANTTSFTEKRWIENTDMIWSMIASGALKETKAQISDNKKIWVEKKNEVLKHLSIFHRPVFRFLLKTTIKYLNLREKVSLLLSEDTYQIRRLFLSMGEDLVKRDLINKPDDIFFLYFDELESILNNSSESSIIKNAVALRKSRLEEDEKIIPDDTVCGDHVIPVYSGEVESGDFLSGICGSSGYKKGYAYVVNNPNEVDRTLTSDDILVVPFSHVGWTLLFSHIGGIIAETGGQLSHTSIIAREYGIPAVVNVPGALHLIRTGQQLTLDADNGRVYLKHISALDGG
jgi:rifampicin phosphotransferase